MATILEEKQVVVAAACLKAFRRALNQETLTEDLAHPIAKYDETEHTIDWVYDVIGNNETLIDEYVQRIVNAIP